MSDGDSDADRIEALELAVTQLADAVEAVVLDLLAQWPRLGVQPVLDQVVHARRLLGVDSGDDVPLGGPEGWSPGDSTPEA